MKLLLLLFCICVGIQSGYAQEAPRDSLMHFDMQPLVITATRTPKELADVPVPVKIIPAEQLQQQGAFRITDALAELTGLTIVHDHGAGIQLQGFDADYTLILIDGEPVIGRTAGTLDLERLTVAGIERVEIVQGPSSSLYGSEALAGVINIITKKAQEPLNLTLGSRLGTHETSDLSATVESRGNNAGVKALFNRYASAGYDLAPESFGATTPSFSDYTSDLRAFYDPTNRTHLSLGARIAVQDQQSGFALEDETGQLLYDQMDSQTDWSLHPEVHHRLTDRFKLEGSFYFAHFTTDTEQVRQDDNALYYADKIQQNYAKTELLTSAIWNSRHLSILGAGYIHEKLAGDRYDTFEPSAGSRFVYLQHEWFPTSKLDLNLSTRFDAHDDYASRLSPKFSVLVKPANNLRLRFSVGSGFKAPAFRQLYLNFTNAAAGYSVLGSTQLSDGLSRLQEDGQIDDLFIDPSTLGDIEAERSLAINTGFSVDIGAKIETTVSLFHNNVQDLIETQPIAQKSNGSFVYSYFNLNRIYTRGGTAEVTYTPHPALQFSAGYQFLQARDKEVVDAIREGNLFGRTASGRDYRLALSDYGGLFGRSTHSGTLRSRFQLPKLQSALTVRAVMRGRYGYRDLDGNQVANLDEEFVPGYMLWNATLTHTRDFPRFATLQFQLGCANLFDITRPALVPNLPGRTLFAGLQVTL